MQYVKVRKDTFTARTRASADLWTIGLGADLPAICKRFPTISLDTIFPRIARNLMDAPPVLIQPYDRPLA
jgi:hypothetical protein